MIPSILQNSEDVFAEHDEKVSLSVGRNEAYKSETKQAVKDGTFFERFNVENADVKYLVNVCTKTIALFENKAEIEIAINKLVKASAFTKSTLKAMIKDEVEIISQRNKEDIKKSNARFKLPPKLNTTQELTKENIEILQNPLIFNIITENEFDKKIVGEIETRKVIFLCAVGGRLVINSQIASFNLLINDEAGAGKDYITNAVLEILPKETYIHKTRISPAVFTYWHNAQYEPEWTWDGKVFYPEDISEIVLNSDVFKVMCSKGSSATIVINQRAFEIEIKGKPVMITTTATATPSPELTRRFVILNLDSSEKQTKSIMRRHSEFKMKGIVPEYDNKYREALKCLKRVKVRIPYAEIIDTHFPTKSLIMRTHYPRFLDFICASAGFHQFQRETDQDGFLLANGMDYDIARGCFIKLCSNKYMIPLTINQKKILAEFERNAELKGSVTHLHSTKMSFLSDRALQHNLQLLVKYGILETDIEKDSMNRDREVYAISKSYKPNEKIDIPKYEDLLCRNTSVSSSSSLSSTSSLSSLSHHINIDTEDTEDAEATKWGVNTENFFLNPKINVLIKENDKGEGVDFETLHRLSCLSISDLEGELKHLSTTGDIFENKPNRWKII